MRKILLTAVVLAMFGLTVVGCRAEGEIDTSTAIAAPR
jgi:hypothetical protein